MESEFHTIVFKKDKVQDLNMNQLELEVHDTFKKDEKITTVFEPVNNEDVINRAHLDVKISIKYDHISYIEKNYEFKIQYNKQSVEGNSIPRAVKTAIQILYDKNLFDNFANADDVLEDFLFTARRRDDLEEKNYGIERFSSYIQFKK